MEKSMKEKLILAYGYGVNAKIKDEKAVPAWCKNYCALIDGLEVGQGAAKIAKAWLNGWHSTNAVLEMDRSEIERKSQIAKCVSTLKTIDYVGSNKFYEVMNEVNSTYCVDVINVARRITNI